MTDLKTAYRFHRSAYPARPAIALQRARQDVEAGTRRYASGFWWKPESAGFGAPFNGGLRWSENPAKLGFRFVGWADEIAKREGYQRAIEHTGWFTDTDLQDEVLRGCVYQLPARNGKPVYFPAYREGCESRNGGWKDTAFGHDHGAAAIDMSDSIDRRIVLYESPWEAARAADSLARQAAEKQREYNAAWQAARQWEEAGESMTETRGDARQLVRDMRAAIASGIAAAPSICTALRAQLRGLLNQLEALRETRDKLESEFCYWDPDGKRWGIAEFARIHL